MNQIAFYRFVLELCVSIPRDLEITPTSDGVHISCNVLINPLIDTTEK